MTDATLSIKESPVSAAAISAAEPASAGEELDVDARDADLPSDDGADLQLAGGFLTDEELAAVTAVLGTLAGAAAAEHNGAGSAGPSDRTLQRRRRLGLWGRPGPDSWKHAAGLR